MDRPRMGRGGVPAVDTTPFVRAGALAIPIWRDPWMVVGTSTFTGDVARRLGWANAFDHHEERYPRVELAEIDRDSLGLNRTG